MSSEKLKAMEDAFKVIHEEFLEVDHLKDDKVIKRLIDSGVKQGIAASISQKASEFKIIFKGNKSSVVPTPNFRAASNSNYNQYSTEIEAEDEDDQFFED